MGGVINVRDQEQGIQHIADLEGSIDGAVTHPIPSRPFRLAGMPSQPHGARKGPPKERSVEPKRRPAPLRRAGARSHQKRNRQRLATHARRLRR